MLYMNAIYQALDPEGKAICLERLFFIYVYVKSQLSFKFCCYIHILFKIILSMFLI